MTLETHHESFALHPIGYIESGYHNFDDVPHPHEKKGWNEDISTIVLNSEHAGKITGLEGYSHIIVLFWIHRSGEWRMPEYHHQPSHVKVFATRMPVRPNPIGLSVVELLDFSPDSGRVSVKRLDALNMTPVLDIKPYIPDSDSYPEASLPDWVGRHLREHQHSNGE